MSFRVLWFKNGKRGVSKGEPATPCAHLVIWYGKKPQLIPKAKQQEVLPLTKDKEVFEIVVDYAVLVQRSVASAPPIGVKMVDLVRADIAFGSCRTPVRCIAAVKGCNELRLRKNKMLVQPLPNIQILPLGEAFVEAANLFKTAFPDCGGGRGGYVFLFEQSAIEILDDEVLCGLFNRCELLYKILIGRKGIVVRAKHLRFGVFGGEFCQDLQMEATPNIVSVQESNPIVARGSNPCVSCRGHSPIGFLDHSNTFIRKGFHHLQSPVRRAVIDNDKFEIAVRLIENAANGLGYAGLLIVDGNYDREKHRLTFEHTG